MRTILTTTALFVALFAASCNQTPPPATDNNNSGDMSIQRAGTAAKTTTDKRSNLSKNWKKGAEFYLYLKVEGTFEGLLDAAVVSTGTWELDEENNILTLVKDKNTEGKVSDAVVKFTVLENTEAKLRLKDANDKEWEFAAQ